MTVIVALVGGVGAAAYRPVTEFLKNRNRPEFRTVEVDRGTIRYTVNATGTVEPKLSILIVNLWLGFPYMFLVTTGAIQAIPDDINEAGKVDGARTWQIFRYIKFPLLLVAVAPLLISSFAFNFNNFVRIYMLTGGGPRFPDASINVGASDILISMVYKVAFVGGLRDFGLASAFSTRARAGRIRSSIWRWSWSGSRPGGWPSRRRSPISAPRPGTNWPPTRC